MKITKVIHTLKLATIGLGIAIGATSFVPASAQKSNSDISEIGWESRISKMGLNRNKNINRKYKFDCQAAPEDFIHAPIWGTKVYTANSGICSAAVHAGMFDLEEGGTITIKLVKGKNFYTGSNKNSVKSEDHEGTKMSFIFVGHKKANDEKAESKKADDEKADDEKGQSSQIQQVLVDGFTRGVERSIEKAIIDLFK